MQIQVSKKVREMIAKIRRWILHNLLRFFSLSLRAHEKSKPIFEHLGDELKKETGVIKNVIYLVRNKQQIVSTCRLGMRCSSPYPYNLNLVDASLLAQYNLPRISQITPCKKLKI